jgi:hypothetical protein
MALVFYAFYCIWDDRSTPPCPDFFSLRWWSHNLFFVFLTGWPGTVILPISAFQVTRMSYRCPAKVLFIDIRNNMCCCISNRVRKHQIKNSVFSSMTIGLVE